MKPSDIRKDISEKGYPLCYSSKQDWVAWKELNQSSSYLKQHFCADCSAKYQKEMIAQGRCVHPETRIYIDDLKSIERKENQVLAAHLYTVEKMTIHQIAEKFHKSKDAIREWLAEQGVKVKKNGHKGIARDHLDKIIPLVKEGKSFSFIGREIGFHRSSVIKAYREYEAQKNAS